MLALIDGRMGLIDVLNEECVRPNGSNDGFISKLESLHKSHAAFSRRKTSRVHFSVKHYAGTVEVRKVCFARPSCVFISVPLWAVYRGGLA